MWRAVIQTVPVRETFSLPRYGNKLLSLITACRLNLDEVIR